MKTLVDEIRDIVDEARTRGIYPAETHKSWCLLRHERGGASAEADLFTKIADRIEREYMEMPRFEDGELVKVGDMVLWGDNKAKRVDGIHVNVHLEGMCGTYNTILKRPVTEVLDADGVPIKVGDVVWFVGGAEYFDVLGIESDGEVHVGRNDGTSTDAWVSPGDLTHKQPDTLERIEADVMDELWHYWGCSGARCDECPALIDGKNPKDHYHTDSCEDAKVLDLLRRQREVLERGQE